LDAGDDKTEELLKQAQAGNAAAFEDQLLGISEAAANKRYIRALQRLRGILENLGVSDVP
jgi:hypothetical protein